MFGIVAQSVTLDLKDGSWIVGGAQGTSTVPLFMPMPKPMSVFSMKVDKTWIVWDERGLTVRTPKGSKSTKFIEVPTSPRVQPKAAIQEFLARMGKGEVTKEASGLSGWELIGDTLFIVVRWSDKAGEPWLETLMKLDTTNTKELRPEFVSRLNGITQARSGVSDELNTYGNKLVAVVENSGGWGLATWDLQEGYSRYQQVGQHLGRHSLRVEQNTLLYTESEPYGEERAGALDLKSMTRTDFFQTRGTIKFVQFPQTVLGITRGDKLSLHVADSGLQVEYPADSAYTVASQGIIVWTPKAKPETGWLLDPVTLKSKATWQRSIPAIPILPKPPR